VRCEDVRTSLSALFDGEQPVFDAALVRHHLRRCPRCRGFVHAIRDLGVEIDRWKRVSQRPVL
jgi:predicted anti-sigma-YlaC factor YlaD